MILIKAQNISYLQNRVAYTRDEAAFKKLYFYFYERLFRFCKKLLSDTEVAEEITGDVLLKIWLMENKLGLIENLEVYLFKMIKNACFTHLSQIKNQQKNTNNIPESHATYDTADQKLMVHETENQLEKAILMLPPQCQMVFRLVREQGFSYRYISEIMDISQNTIETHMRIALRKIRLQLSEYLSEKNN